MTAIGSPPMIEQDTIAHFLYRGSAASVSVPGDANGWNPNSFPMTRISGTTLWYHTHVFEPDARLDYKFVLDGSSWILDPRNPHQVSGGFGPNSELRMPAYLPAPEIQYFPAIPHGTLRDTVFHSALLGNSRTVRIYTPPGYLSSSDSLPVVFVHDGLEYVSLAQMNNVIDHLISQNRIRPIIAVFIPPVNRTEEYAGSQMAAFSSFLVNDIVPYIDLRYRVRHDPEDRATLGASNGGNISLWLGFHYPDVFGNIAAQSSNIVGSLSTGFGQSSPLNLKIYMDLGTYDIAELIPLVHNFIPILQSKGYAFQYQEYHEGHSWGNWRAHVDNALEYFFPAAPTSVGGDESGSPEPFALEQNYPNPYNPITTMSFVISNSSLVTLKVYNTLGQEVATVIDHHLVEKGRQEVKFDGSILGSGVYFYRLESGRATATRKMLIVK